MPIVRNNTALDKRTAIEKRMKNSGETIKQILCPISINEQRPKLKIQVHNAIEDLVDRGAGATIISSESWHPN